LLLKIGKYTYIYERSNEYDKTISFFVVVAHSYYLLLLLLRAHGSSRKESSELPYCMQRLSIAWVPKKRPPKNLKSLGARRQDPFKFWTAEFNELRIDPFRSPLTCSSTDLIRWMIRWSVMEVISHSELCRKYSRGHVCKKPSLSIISWCCVTSNEALSQGAADVRSPRGEEKIRTGICDSRNLALEQNDSNSVVSYKRQYGTIPYESYVHGTRSSKLKRGWNDLFLTKI